MKRVLPFGAVVLVAAGLGFLPMIGCLASAEQAASDEEGQDAELGDVPLTSEAVRVRGERGRRCGVNGQRCCARPCCRDGSTCVYRHHARICMQDPPPDSRIVGGGTCSD